MPARPGVSLLIVGLLSLVNGKGVAASPTSGEDTPAAITLEAADPELAGARLRVAVAGTAANHQGLAALYFKHGILDAAFDHYQSALDLDPKDAASADGLARIWRNWGFPELGLAYVYRARFLAPSSPVPENTLGTLLIKMDLLTDARHAFERALTLDPSATYARINVCYVLRLERQPGDVVDACYRDAHVDRH